MVTCYICKRSIVYPKEYMEKSNDTYCVPCYEKKFSKNCAKCKTLIKAGQKSFGMSSKDYHDTCFTCEHCKLDLSKNIYEKNGNLYCSKCYDTKFSPKCFKCQNIISASSMRNTYKSQMFHSDCFSCTYCNVKFGANSFYPKDNMDMYCLQCEDNLFGKKCDKCRKIIMGKYTVYKNQDMHEECFKCTICSTQIKGIEFQEIGDNPYCISCYGKNFAKSCSFCNKPIIGRHRSANERNKQWHDNCFKCIYCHVSLINSTFYYDKKDDPICAKCQSEENGYTALCTISSIHPEASLRRIAQVKLIDGNDEFYKIVKKYSENTNCHFQSFTFSRAFKIEKIRGLFDQFTGGPNRMLLWHGTKRGNIGGILKNDFKCPGQSNGQMFGAGIYFADRASKSAQYCDKNLSPAYLFLCEVDLGSVHMTQKADNWITGPPDGKDSIMGIGQYKPNDKEFIKIDSVTIPLGTTIVNELCKSSSLRYNEYIVYNENRIRIKYLVEVQF